VLDEFGNPMPGELLTIDQNGIGLAGGYLEDGRAIVVNVVSGAWFDIETRLSITPGTLSSVVGINSFDGRIAMAVSGSDLTGWDVTANIISVPGPGWMLAPSLLLVGALTHRSRG
jgi:hypothetical protein